MPIFRGMSDRYEYHAYSCTDLFNDRSMSESER